MTLAQKIAQEVESLPEDRQREVMEFVKFLHSRTHGKGEPLESAWGLWKDFGVSVTEEDIAEARREMWGNFPRGDI